MRYAPRSLQLGQTAACLALSLLASCHLTNAVRGSGIILEEERLVSGFHGVAVTGSGQVTVTEGTSEGLTIQCDDNLLPHLKSTVEDGILHIGFERGYWQPSEPVIYHVSGHVFDTFRVSGSADLTCKSMEGDGVSLRLSGSGTARIGTVTAQSLGVSTSGSGEAWIDRLEAEDVGISISGSGEVSVAGGELHNLEATTSGSGDLGMPDVRAANASVGISGSGTAALWVEESLSARISGSGTIGLKGAPEVNLRVSGSGSVYELGSAQY